MPAYIRLKGYVSLSEGDEVNYEIECPECHTHYCPRDPITGGLELMKGRLYIVECPECGHGLIVRQLAEAIDEVD